MCRAVGNRAVPSALWSGAGAVPPGILMEEMLAGCVCGFGSVPHRGAAWRCVFRPVGRAVAGWHTIAARQELASSFNPAMPATMHSMQPRRAAVAGSSNSTMPSSAVPTVPTPVHTA